MKKIIGFVSTICLLWSCKNLESANSDNSNFENRLDSLKWLYYSYTFDGVALFHKDTSHYNFNPTECGIKVEKIDKVSIDSFAVSFSLVREGYKFSHIYDGIPLFGFTNFKNVVQPIISEIIPHTLKDSLADRQYNRSRDSLFAIFLKQENPDRLSEWLLKEAKRRNVIR